MTEKYDVVVIGAGVAGLGTAAILARDFKQKVLVLERNPFIGGRLASFVGKGDKVCIDGMELDANGFKRVLGMVGAWVPKCTPDLETCFKEKIFDGCTLDTGHGLFWGNKGKIRMLMNYLEKPVDMPCNVGFAFVDYKKGNKAYQVGKGEPYAWMSKEGFRATMMALRDMALMSLADIAQTAHMSFEQWLQARNVPKEAYDYIKVLAASQTGQADLNLTPAPDVLGHMATAGPIRMNLVEGSCATVANPGTMAFALLMEQALTAHGGKVLRSAPVVEVIIENGVVKGVTFQYEKGIETAYADRVICTVPSKQMLNVIHPRYFPQEIVDRVQTKFWGAGMITGYGNMKSDIWADKGIEERSFMYMPDVIGAEEGYSGCIDMVLWNLASVARGSNSNPSLTSETGAAPEGKHGWIFSTAMTHEEMRTPRKVARVVEWNEDWWKKTFGRAKWEAEMEFLLWMCTDHAFGWIQPIGTDRIDVKSPYVDGLYFAGDQYGERLWGCGVDAAALSATLCVDSMMGSNAEEKVFPFYHRAVPPWKKAW
ncbi:MAG: FAD-dependent oxidoreductase [Syntrophales bacterium]|jgi:monoamine oxidase|nr:FAD-dependent oxidoreductase [Syntrophales bacterium]MDD4338073.1 FAD-dependent oxidoreductase [Syntrophales bacterium]HOG07118.1 FAD-dependent oxidoreductase [Syntrophales bacterium]HPB70028.1 FAD-dependent oxidoreductase [Syntrophales bacterium]HQN25801.1 FAD-dependent oxidoreductase [Syntrophales bacterium]